MPTFPHTRKGETSWPDKKPDLRYWSLSVGGTAPSGLGWDTIYDEQIPLNDDREYVIVMSRVSTVLLTQPLKTALSGSSLESVKDFLSAQETG